MSIDGGAKGRCPLEYAAMRGDSSARDASAFAAVLRCGAEFAVAFATVFVLLLWHRAQTRGLAASWPMDFPVPWPRPATLAGVLGLGRQLEPCVAGVSSALWLVAARAARRGSPRVARAAAIGAATLLVVAAVMPHAAVALHILQALARGAWRMADAWRSPAMLAGTTATSAAFGLLALGAAAFRTPAGRRRWLGVVLVGVGGLWVARGCASFDFGWSTAASLSYRALAWLARGDSPGPATPYAMDGPCAAHGAALAAGAIAAVTAAAGVAALRRAPRWRAWATLAGMLWAIEATLVLVPPAVANVAGAIWPWRTSPASIAADVFSLSGMGFPLATVQSALFAALVLALARRDAIDARRHAGESGSVGVDSGPALDGPPSDGR